MPLEIIAIKSNPKAKQQPPQSEPVVAKSLGDRGAPQPQAQEQVKRQQALARLILQVQVGGTAEEPEFQFSHNGIVLEAVVRRGALLNWGAENIGFVGDRYITAWVRTNSDGIISLELRSIHPPGGKSPYKYGVAIAGYAEPGSEIVQIQPRPHIGIDPFEIRCHELAVPAAGHWYIRCDLGDQGQLITASARRRDPEAHIAQSKAQARARAKARARARAKSKKAQEKEKEQEQKPQPLVAQPPRRPQI